MGGGLDVVPPDDGDVVGNSHTVALQAADKGLTLQIDRGPCPTVSDRELVGMILQNLLANAIKYTTRGTVRVAAKTTDDGCLVSVSDQGQGIPQDKLGELFGAFTRGDTHGQPGVGLGLSIARQAADVLGAKLWAESTVGEGSTFHLHLPREPLKQPAPTGT